MRVLFIDVSKKESKVKIIENPNIKGVLDLGIYLHLEEYNSWKHEVYSQNNVIVFGTGKLNYGGTQRGVFVFRSPLHGGIHASSIGDLGEYIKLAGFDAIVIEGKSPKPVFIIIENDNVIFLEEKIPEKISEKSMELYKKLKDLYGEKKFRMVLVGLASANTDYGALVSFRSDKPEVVDIAARGGGGSVLYRAHNVVGLSIGGDNKVEVLQYDMQKVLEATKKYRDDGTFRGNYPSMRGNLPYLNYQNIYLSKEGREDFYKKFVEAILLKDYNFSSDTCGEKCVAACKKIEKNVKIDYEPANGLGPFIGIFNRELVRDLIKTCDDYGFDAIYLGFVLGAVMEGLSKGLIKPEDLGLSEKPILDINEYKEDYSEKNYRIAKSLIEKIAKGEIKILGEGIRKIAKNLNIKDISIYIPFGEKYDITQNFYWTLGLILPIIMHGKYFSDYHFTAKQPEEYAEACFKRGLYEYTLENYGVCRFHRGWVENYLIKEEDLKNAKYWFRKLIEYRKLANAEPVFWESKRMIDIVKKLLEEFNLNISPEEYWNRWYKKYLELIFTDN